MASNTLTARNHKITLQIDGVTIPGDWKTFSGGGISSESTTNRPGGMANRESLGGVAERENVAISREYDWARDGGLIGPGGFLDTAVENNADSVVTVQRLNNRKQPVGPPRMYVGTIQMATDAELDSEDSAVQTLNVECTAIN